MISEKIKELRKSHDLSQREMARQLNISYVTICLWENGKREPDLETIDNLAKFFNVNISYLVDDEKSEPKNRIPVLGSIPAGIPIEMIEDIIDYEDIPLEWTNGDKEYFALKVKGDSMEPEYINGDVIIVRKQDDCETGEECIVSINGFDATFKKVIKKENGIILQPFNTKYEPIVYTKGDIENLPVKILGVVVELRRTKRR